MKVLKYLLVFIISVVLMGCSAPNTQPETIAVFAMDTFMTITAYGNNAKTAVAVCEDEIEKLDSAFSATSEFSDISNINQNGSAVVSSDTIDIITTANDISQKTDGNFDITIYPVMLAYGFTAAEFSVPDDDEISELLQTVGYQNITIDQNTVSVEEGTKIDLGAIAKGYLSDRLFSILKQNGINSAMMSLGGNVAVVGKKTDGSLWRIGIEDPNDAENYVASVSVSDSFVVTSGSYKRFFEDGGKLYHHIIDPATGKPSDNGLVSVTVISKNGTIADALSTAFFVSGLDGAPKILSQFDDVEAVFITEQNEIIATNGLKQNLTLASNSSYALEFLD